VGTKLSAIEQSGQAASLRARTNTTAAPRSRLTWVPLMSIAAAAFAVEVPFFFLGIPSGHDLEFHLYSWLDVLSQWKHGIFYPRWAALAHFAYGEPRFIFYPPASWTLGAALGAIFPWALVPGIYIWIVLVAAGASMFLLARQWLDRRNATFAAVLYAVNPYHLVIVYWRSAFAELLASSLLPLLLLLLLRTEEKRHRATILLALVLAAAWLVNAPAALMIHYSTALLIVVIAWQRRSPRVALAGAAAIVLGAALAAFYLLPVVFEQKWVNIAEATGAGLRPGDSFLFAHTTDADHDIFDHLVSWVATAEILLTIATAWAARRWRHSNRELWLPLLAWAAVCAVLMLSITAPLWNILPKLRFIQFPWRFLLCLGIPFALLTTLGVRRWASRLAIYLAMLCVLAFVWHHLLPPWWDHAPDLREMQDNIAAGAGYEGTDEYTPVGADSYNVDKAARRVTVDGPAHAAIRVSDWSAENKIFTAEMSAPDNLALHLFNYPAWRVEVNGQPVQAGTREDTGQMLIPVAAGTNRVQITFARTWDRTAGAWISLLALFSTIVLLRKSPPSPVQQVALKPLMHRILIATSNAGKLRDFAGAALRHGVEIAGLPDFSSLPPVVEDGLTFEVNAQKKAEAYSRSAPGEIVVADDSGLEIDALNGAPGVHSARYAAPDLHHKEPHEAEANTDDEANNARVLRELKDIPYAQRTGRFVCVLAAARDGKTLATFRGTAEGIILDAARGLNGFGYDPLFYFPPIEKTFAELTVEEKSKHSHRGAAFRKFLDWCKDLNCADHPAVKAWFKGSGEGGRDPSSRW
jgi:non-canonical purine NTP pyrophosphatase (RdgB/HAM1 family)